MAFNPFSSDSEDTSFENGSPIQQTTQNAVKASASQLVSQQKAFSQALKDQLYGAKSDAENAHAQEGAKKEQEAPGMKTLSKQTPQNAGDEKQLEETRKKLHELQRMHKENYFEKTLGDSARKKLAQEEEQEKQQKEQAEEAAKQEAMEAKAAQEESFGGVAPQGKTTGRNRMQKPLIALKQATTKTESNRGTTG